MGTRGWPILPIAKWGYMPLPDGLRKIERERVLSADGVSKVLFTAKSTIEVAAIRTAGTGNVAVTLEHSADGINFETQGGGGSFAMTINSGTTQFAQGTLESGIYRLAYGHSGASMTFDVTVTEHD